jgi:hypothetical protein
MGKSNPSSVGYARGTMVSTQVNTRETFGGSSKAGIAPRTGLNPRANSAVQFRSAPVTGNSFLAAWKAGHLASPIYPIGMTNQLGGIGRLHHGMTRFPSDGVNINDRARMQLSVNAWGQIPKGMPIRGTPSAFKTVPFSFYNQSIQYPPITNDIFTNVYGKTAQVNVTAPVTVAGPDAGGYGLSQIVGGKSGTISV